MKNVRGMQSLVAHFNLMRKIQVRRKTIQCSFSSDSGPSKMVSWGPFALSVVNRMMRKGHHTHK